MIFLRLSKNTLIPKYKSVKPWLYGVYDNWEAFYNARYDPKVV
jgi:hypothetical protein